MGKVKSHTGFRNEELFCFNCGTSYNMNMPQPINMATAMMKQFDIDHKNCAKIWEEPKIESNGKTEQQNVNWWVVNGEHGISSKTMFNYLSDTQKIQNSGECTPCDPDDFSRCYKLIKAVPQFRDKLSRMKSVSKTWSNIVDNWDKLSEMYEENVRTQWKNYKNVGMYEFMKSIGC